MEVSDLRRKRIWIIPAVVGHRQGFRGIERPLLESMLCRCSKCNDSEIAE